MRALTIFTAPPTQKASPLALRSSALTAEKANRRTTGTQEYRLTAVLPEKP
jgi:hypothetical protein